MSHCSYTTASTPQIFTFHWRDLPLWKQASKNTGWCLSGWAIGDFGTAPLLVASLAMLKRAQQMHVSLEEIKQLLALDRSPGIPKPAVRHLVKTKLIEINDHLDELLILKNQLQALLASCKESNAKTQCPILAGIKHDT